MVGLYISTHQHLQDISFSRAQCEKQNIKIKNFFMYWKQEKASNRPARFAKLLWFQKRDLLLENVVSPCKFLICYIMHLEIINIWCLMLSRLLADIGFLKVHLCDMSYMIYDLFPAGYYH